MLEQFLDGAHAGHAIADDDQAFTGVCDHVYGRPPQMWTPARAAASCRQRRRTVAMPANAAIANTEKSTKPR
jgi:hypothetical protein